MQSTCQHPDCRQRATVLCRLAAGDPAPEWLCGRHAVEAGHCFGCGAYIGRTTDDASGLCVECESLLRSLSGASQEGDYAA